jgi:hypothetical protein
MTEKLFNVVFRGVGQENGGNYKGVVTWTSFKSEAEYRKWQARTKSPDEVIATGVTQEEAIEFVKGAPIQPYINAKVQEAMEPGGVINPEKLSLGLAGIAFLNPEALRKHIEGN